MRFWGLGSRRVVLFLSRLIAQLLCIVAIFLSAAAFAVRLCIIILAVVFVVLNAFLCYNPPLFKRFQKAICSWPVLQLDSVLFGALHSLSRYPGEKLL